jgi:hypothetical protein
MQCVEKKLYAGTHSGAEQISDCTDESRDLCRDSQLGGRAEPRLSSHFQMIWKRGFFELSEWAERGGE